MGSIGSKLHEFRRKRGLSRRQVVDGICDESTLYRIENDQQEPQLFTLRQICKKLGISLAHILSTDDLEMNNYKSKMKHMCRKYVYDQDYLSLDLTIKTIEDDLLDNRLNDLDFSRFILWHKAILSHKVTNNINQAKHKLLNLMPKKGRLITETDFGIANSLGYIYLKLNKNHEALQIYETLSSQYENLPVIEDKLLYVRVMYNYIYTLYYIENYHEVIIKGDRLIEFLETNYLYIMFPQLNHMIGISYEKIGSLLEAEKHMQKAVDIFFLNNQLYNYLKSLRALAEVQIKSGKTDEGIISIQKLKERIGEIQEPNNLMHLVEEMERKYLIISPSTLLSSSVFVEKHSK